MWGRRSTLREWGGECERKVKNGIEGGEGKERGREGERGVGDEGWSGRK